ncbi:hypothetical protein L6164_006527 [Bauhinia variegata]|uniref:Uncharacterized protein n=1 Tax=Bauhinia variegata TaxID=167791 RepID=A0ACB9PU71_BAUVA|nr:hypothetical protein L6164_006527 [Bauhinia variegata]
MLGNKVQILQSSSVLEVNCHEEQQNDMRTKMGHGCWNKVLDFDEAKIQILYALPIILNSLFYYLITLVSAMFAGRLGELQLAGASLANSWNFISGLAVVAG